jgi:hypothetical protein
VANAPISVEILRATLAAVEQHGSVAGAALALGLSRATFQHRHREALRRQSLGEFEPIEAIDGQTEIRPRLAFEREWQTWMKAIGMAKDRYAGPAMPKARAGRLKILVVPDLHAPFHDPAAVAAMLEREKDIDICVLMGDIGDSYSLSRFLKYESVAYEDELASVTLLLQAFSERYPIVRVITGNHDGPRLEKQLLERLSGDMVTAIRSMTGGTLDPIEVLCRRFPNIERVTPTADGHRLRWMTQIGDALFMHAEKWSKVPGAAMRAIDEWVTDFEDAIDLKDYRVLVQAHTHALSWFPWKANRLLIECGCLCRAQGYQFTARIGGRPQRRGYVYLEQVDGKTDINRSRIVWLDPELEAEP